MEHSRPRGGKWQGARTVQRDRQEGTKLSWPPWQPKRETSDFYLPGHPEDRNDGLSPGYLTPRKLVLSGLL